MEELMRTNDLVMISLVESILKELGIAYFIADQSISALDGSIGILPRRILVDAEAIAHARRMLVEAGLDKELAQPARGILPW